MQRPLAWRWTWTFIFLLVARAGAKPARFISKAPLHATPITAHRATEQPKHGNAAFELGQRSAESALSGAPFSPAF